MNTQTKITIDLADLDAHSLKQMAYALVHAAAEQSDRKQQHKLWQAAVRATFELTTRSKTPATAERNTAELQEMIEHLERGMARNAR